MIDKTRETITIEENRIFEIIYEERLCYEGSNDWDNPEFKLVSKKDKYTDLSKRYTDIEFVVERMSDNTFWKGEYIKTSQDDIIEDTNLYEVFENKVVTTVITYE